MNYFNALIKSCYSCGGERSVDQDIEIFELSTPNNSQQEEISHGFSCQCYFFLLLKSNKTKQI